MSTFIRRYARYLNEKAYAYRAMAFDFTRVKKGYVIVSCVSQLDSKYSTYYKTVTYCFMLNGYVKF